MPEPKGRHPPDPKDESGPALIGRKRMLQKALKKAGPVLRFAEHLSAEAGRGHVPTRLRAGLEGIVSKLMSRYKSGACTSWVKVKNPAYERRSMRS